ncbi:hypothetical protein WR25_17366 [Diploscapter pachys]|uniref:phosphoribosylformylglycinamidine synthase n=1 Tax=Diploscapter pachys TaxID=2018661 RepID=A0A2A2KT98_9BILA|nr:hypothetical protein WR25_17366 [Diploscapter pachys]
MPWEEEKEIYPNSLSHPRQIIIEASNGASDYGNKFGEPVICGFARTFGMRLPDGSRREYLKPIMFSGGIGSIDENQLYKEKCSEGQLVAKIGGPVYRIGVGGGAASSLSVQGSRENDLDFAAVQRGDAEMGAKLHRVVRGCVELGDKNPILAIHDQGAGGNGNVIKELVEGYGVRVDSTKFHLGDETISSKELWTAEYQESDACLVDSQLVKSIQEICKREKCPLSIVGEVTKEQRVILSNFPESKKKSRNPVDLDTHLIGTREKKIFNLSRTPNLLRELQLPDSLTVKQALSMVLRLPSVACKRYLTCKVDRSVTGLIAQQQCVGPLHTPLADVAVVALSHFDTVGGAMAVGEQPIKGLVDVQAGARMTVAETLTNLVFAQISDIKDIKMSGNWMWAAKAEGEGAKMVDAVDSLCQALKEVGVAVDGGKDSLSMVVSAGNELVKAPGTLVLTAYVTCSDVRKVVTPDLKASRDSSQQLPKLLYVRMGSDPKKDHRLGGSAFAQCHKQIGNDVPDIHDFDQFVETFIVIQRLIEEGNILAGHDVSDGGLITTILEMAFAGNMGLEIDLGFDTTTIPLLSYLFAEEAGVVLEVESDHVQEIVEQFSKINNPAEIIGTVHKVYGPDANIKLMVNQQEIFNETLVRMREIWEETGDRLGEFQTDKECLKQAKEIRQTIKLINYAMSVELPVPRHHLVTEIAPKVAILREEGSNGDREMAAVFRMAGFNVFDVTMTDLLGGFRLDQFRGIAFVGGFSYADVLGSAKGWAAAVLYNEKIRHEFDRFRTRSDTFSFGVCNGCQLMTLLGWVGTYKNQPSVFLDENKCGRFESYFGPVKIRKSKSLMLQGMENSLLGLWSSHGEGWGFPSNKQKCLKSLYFRKIYLSKWKSTRSFTRE